MALALDLHAALDSAEATVRGAIARRESRGAHQRADCPALDEAMRVNFTISRGSNSELLVGTQDMPPVPAELEAWLKAPDLEVAGRLLE